MLRFLSNYLEIIFTALGLVVIFAVPTLFHHEGWAYPLWQAAAVTAIAVGVIHGLLFFIVRRRQRNARLEIIREVRNIADVVANRAQAAVLSIAVEDQQKLIAAAHDLRIFSDQLYSQNG